MKKSAIIVPALALFVGVGIGNAGNAETKEAASKADAAASEPVEKIVEKTVEVPVEKIVEKVVEKKVEVKVVPKACLDAISAARDVAAGVAVFSDAAGNYPPLVSEAFQAGILQDQGAAADILDEMKSANAGMDKAVAMTAPAVADFNKAAEGCKK